MDLDRVTAEIRAELGRQELTLADLARALGVGHQWLYRRIHRGRPQTVDIELHTIAQIARALGVSARQFTDPHPKSRRKETPPDDQPR